MQILGPSIETLRAAIDDVAVHLCSAGRRPTRRRTLRKSKVRSLPSSIGLEEMRASGETRDLSMDDIIRLMAFDFALGQLRLNLRDIAERAPELAAFAGSTFPLIRRLQGNRGDWK